MRYRVVVVDYGPQTSICIKIFQMSHDMFRCLGPAVYHIETSLRELDDSGHALYRLPQKCIGLIVPGCYRAIQRGREHSW